MKYSGLLLLFVLPFQLSAAEKDIFESLKNRQEAAYQYEESIGLLERSLEQKLSDHQKIMAHFAIGYLAYEAGLRDKAEKNLMAALAGDDGLKAYTFYHLGLLYAKDGKHEAAKQRLEEVLKLNPQRDLVYRTRYELGKLAAAKKHWITAAKHFQYAESKMRSRPEYPEILLNLVRAERERGRSWHSCRWARKLYSRHPHAAVINSWGMDLPSAKIDGKRLGCVATLDDQKRRVMWLQVTGNPDRARKEITDLEKKLGDAGKYDAALLWASFLQRDGDPRGGLNQLLPFYQEKKGDFNYLMEVASYSSRAGEIHAAVGAYYKAYKEHKNQASARQALFRAAFLSYQYQDYDGATQKFIELNTAYPRSGLTRSSKWYLAWVDYLRSNHEASYKAFTEIKNEKKRRGRYWSSYANERIDYWRGMNLMRMKKFEEAKNIFLKLHSDNSLSFYGVASRYRLNHIAVKEGIGIASLAGSRGLASGEPPLVRIKDSPAGIAEAEEMEGDFGSDEAELAAAGDVEPLGEDEAFDIAGEGDPELGLQVSEEGEDFDEGELPLVTSFENTRLQTHFDRAKKLMAMGFHDWARWDLYEIERRTSDKSHLKTLIKNYEDIGAYHRSSYIGQVYFQNQRRKGIANHKPAWEAAFPRPYNQSVSKSAKEFKIPEEFIWSIMRAESFYRPDVQSPAGAMGLMQVMPATGRHLARILGDETFDPETLKQSDVAIRFGTSYLQRLQGFFGDDIPLMAAGYNAGPHRVKNWLLHFGNLEMDEFIEHIPFSETRNYVKKVVSNFEVYKHLYSGETESLKYLTRPVRAKYKGATPLAEDWSDPTT